jgi:hypothetical protein
MDKIKKIWKKIYYFCGSIYRGLIGIFHDASQKLQPIHSKINWHNIGTTIEGRQIKVFQVLSKYNNQKKVLIVGAIHGNEVGTVKLSHQILNWIYRNHKDYTNVNFYVIPVLNMDGYDQAIKNPDYFHRGRIGRFNKNGVDLNRNFPTSKFQKYSKWLSGKNFSEMSVRVFCGESGASESEIKTVTDFIERENIDTVIALHNVGKDVLLNKNDVRAEKWATFYKEKKFKIRYDLEYDSDFASWCKEKNISFMSVEGTSRWGDDWAVQFRPLMKIFEDINTNNY